MQRGNRYERAAKLGASCLREIFLEIRRYTFEQDNIAAILPHAQVAYGFPLYAEAHKRAKVIAVRERVKGILLHTQDG